VSGGTARATLADVLPSVAAALGVPVRGTAVLPLEPARSAVVVLVDGLGAQLLARRGGHAPFLRGLGDAAGRGGLACGFPSTTATSMGTIGTGRPPGTHGLVGLDVLDPTRDVVFSELAWDPDVDPRRWQPGSTLFEEVSALGVDVVRIGPAYFEGSGLTEAALRGGRFVAAGRLEERVDAAVAAVRAPGGSPVLVYLYWGELDKTGHVHGCESWEWGEELSAVDGELARLARLLPPDTQVVVTADHGMVDVPFSRRLDLADEPELAAGVRHLGGEARALHLYCDPGAADRVLATWRDRLGAGFELVTREEAVAGGWFGTVAPSVLPRIGDVVAAATDADEASQVRAVVDSRTARAEVLRLLGLHGARTEAETLVPLLTTPGTGRPRRR
jgi:hypothetical protein